MIDELPVRRDRLVSSLMYPRRYSLAGYCAAVSIYDDAVDRAAQSALGELAVADDGRVVHRTYSVRYENAWQLEADGQRLSSANSREEALAALERQLVLDALEFRPDLLHLHAAALTASSGGAAALLVGASGVGKTTLAQALIRRGFLPFSDDVTLVDPVSLNVLPFRRAFHVGAEYWHPLAWAVDPAPVQLILFLVRSGAPEAGVATLDSADAASRLLIHSGSLTTAPRQTLAATVRLTQRASCLSLELGAPEAAASTIERLCATMARTRQTVG